MALLRTISLPSNRALDAVDPSIGFCLPWTLPAGVVASDLFGLG